MEKQGKEVGGGDLGKESGRNGARGERVREGR